MQITFTTSEEAEKFWKKVRKRRAKIYKTICLWVWAGASMISIFGLFSMLSYRKVSSGWPVLAIVIPVLYVLTTAFALAERIWTKNKD